MIEKNTIVTYSHVRWSYTFLKVIRKNVFDEKN
jgi:hypothetical protein